MKRPSPPLITLIAFVAAAATAPWIISDGSISLLFEVLLMLAMAQLWNLLAGRTGLVSMGLQCFVGLGGYTTIFASNSLSVSPYWVLPLAPLVCGVHALLHPAALRRVRGRHRAPAPARRAGARGRPRTQPTADARPRD